MEVATYDAMKRELFGLLDAMAVLTGDVMPSSKATMKEHIQTAGFHALRLHQQLELAALGRCEPLCVFPSPNDWAEGQK